MMSTTGEKLAFKLSEMAPNVLTPRTYRNLLTEKHYFEVVDGTESVGCHAVGQGSSFNEQGFLAERVIWDGDIALVGKGITFDTGGYSIKSYQHMIGMKYDMVGSAVVLGAMTDLGDKLSVQAQLCVAENRISDDALLPDSEITYSDGTTVIVTDTDAEGRLVLADGILRAKKNGAKVIITVATLTGAIVAALGADTVGVFSSNTDLADKAIDAIGSTGTLRGWHMPFLDDKASKELYKGKKLINWKQGRGLPGHSYAASFLKHFAGDTQFIHLDIAGVATVGEHTKARTEMVRALTALVKELSK